jgi:hypothetical protein
MTDTELSSQYKEYNNSYYYIVFVNIFDKDKILEILNYEQPINYCSLIYKPEYNYKFSDLLDYVKTIDKKYDWKLHEITLENYTLIDSIDVVLDTNIRKNKTTHYIVYDNIMDCKPNYFDQLSLIFKNSDKHIDAIINKDNPYSGLVVPFSTHMILNKNNYEPLIKKMIDNEKNIIYI